MKRLVLDASVLAKLFFAERYSDTCAALVGRASELHAPDLIWAEVGNVVWKRCRRGEVSAEDAAALIDDLLRTPILACPSHELLADAFTLADALGRTVYDCLYVALAVRRKAVLVTDDQRLANALAKSPIAGHIHWVGDSLS